MKGVVLLRVLLGVLVLVLLGWVVRHTRWEEVVVEDPARGLAASDEYYSLRHVLQGAGATLEVRTTLEPLPPAGATLVLETGLWDIFPERDERLHAWVRDGGHLVVQGQFARRGLLRWAPLAFGPQTPTRRKRTTYRETPVETPAPDEPASSAAGSNGDDDPVVGRQLPRMNKQQERLARLAMGQGPGHDCADFEEPPDTPGPAYEPGRVLRGCMPAGVIRPLEGVAPVWQLAGRRGTLALRVPVGRGDVTGVAPGLQTDNRDLLRADDALIAAAIVQAAPGRAVWIVGDEAREPLVAWLWHQARMPSLLALAAIALALWRLMIRFGPREAAPQQARRSMGEQVRGTGQFIAASDARALHAATRQAFDAVARRRVEGWAGLDDSARIEALAASWPQADAPARAALLASMNIGAGATRAQILAAIAVLEQARRTLLRATAH